MERRSISRQLKDTKALSGTSLFFGILASGACAAAIPALGAGRLATVAGAALSPLLVAAITTRGRGPVRSAGIAVLSAIALLITIGGFTVPEAITGSGSLTGKGAGTFVNTERGPAPTPPTPWPRSRALPAVEPPATEPPVPVRKSGPSATPSRAEVELSRTRRCAEVEVGEPKACRISIRNVGAAPVELATGNLEGEHAGDFILTKVCEGPLKPDTACSIHLWFWPTTAGARKASLVVRIQPGDIVRRVTISGDAIEKDTGDKTAPTGCRVGFVPRRTRPSDTVCVTPAERTRVRQQNAAHVEEHRANPDGTCVEGFVWREAVPGDHTCVTWPDRTATQRQNELNAERVTS